MIEEEQYEIVLAQAMRSVAQRVLEIARGAQVAISSLEWHRGHEVADLDQCWLAVTSGKHAITEHFPNEWLEGFAKSGFDSNLASRLSAIVNALTSAPELHTNE